jgi:polar amino acid transport system substrate-binding protein
MGRKIFALLIPILFGVLPVSAAPLPVVKERKYLIVAVKADLYPLSFIDGERAGFEVDLARELARKLFGDSQAIRFVTVKNQERQEFLEKDQVDLVIADWSITVPRARTTDFSLPYLTTSQHILVKNSSSIQKLSDLSRRKIAILQGSSGGVALKNFVPEVALVTVKSYAEGAEAVELGRVEGFAADGTVLSGWAKQHPAYRLINTELDATALAIGMPRGLEADSLRRWVNAQIADLLKTGWLAEKANAWGIK